MSRTTVDDKKQSCFIWNLRKTNMKTDQQEMERRTSSTKNRQAILSAFCIGLINRKADIKIKVRLTHSHLYLPFLRIKTIQIDDRNTIHVGGVAKVKVVQTESSDLKRGINPQTTFHRRKKRIVKETNSIIYGVLQSFGYDFEFGESHSYTHKNFNHLIAIRKGPDYFDSSSIISIGNLIYKSLKPQINRSGSLLIHRNNLGITNVFNAFIHSF